MKKKIVGIFVVTLLITTALPAIGLKNIKEIETINGPSLSENNRQIKTIEKPFIEGNRGALFMQLPANPNEQFNGYLSDQDWGWRPFDEFWNVSGPICDIHWWGSGKFWNGTHWVDGCVTDMIFDITFYHDDGTGKPGDEACNYIDISPTIIPTGIYYEAYWVPGGFQLYYFEVDLDPCCQLSDGWISVFKTYNPCDCIFSWMVCPDANWNMWTRNLTSGEWHWSNWDLSFILTDGEPDIPDLECDGELSWTGVPPGATVTGDFVVRNNGDPDSILHWKVDESSIPNWGVNWKFTPNASILTTAAGWLTVDVEVEAPDVQDSVFTGKIKVVNAADSGDYCEIDVRLETPRNRGIFLNFFEQILNQFPMLKILFGF